MASGLAYLHSEKIYHGDIKPQNILISLNDPVQMKLADFGMSKEVAYRGDFSQPNIDSKSDMEEDARGFFTLTTIRGTPGWTSPETIKQ